MTWQHCVLPKASDRMWRVKDENGNYKLGIKLGFSGSLVLVGSTSPHPITNICFSQQKRLLIESTEQLGR